jgi:hypothetical protein
MIWKLNNLCGEVFTAPKPEGAGPDKYDENPSGKHYLSAFCKH